MSHYDFKVGLLIATSVFIGVLFAFVLASHILTWDVRFSQPMQIEAVDVGSGEIQRANSSYPDDMG